MNTISAATRRSRLFLIGLAALFLVPLAVSFFLYYGTSWRPAGGAQHGELVLPPRPLPAVVLAQPDGRPTAEDWLRNRWHLVYLGPGACDPDCRAALWLTRQVRLSLDKDMGRVVRVFLYDGEAPDTALLAGEHPDLIAAGIAGEAAAPLLAAFPEAEAARAGGRLYLVDPLGNLMMTYPIDTPPKGLLDDLERLLKLSHIG